MDLEIAIPSEVNQRKTNIIYIHYILYYIYIYKTYNMPICGI